jgi:hypothetical protein
MDPELRSAIIHVGGGPPARPPDVRSPQALAHALYEAISGPAERERPRDWDRVRSLFLPGARLVLVRWQRPDGTQEEALRVWDVEGFIETSKRFYAESAFHEREIGNRTDRFGHIAQVFSTYAAFLGPEHEEPVMRGINSIQAVSDGKRWWVQSLVWDVERPDNPIPDAYLPGPTA